MYNDIENVHEKTFNQRNKIKIERGMITAIRTSTLNIFERTGIK